MGSPPRTAVWAAGVFIAGVLSHSILPPRPDVYLMLLAGCCVLAAALFRFPRICTTFLTAGLMIAALLAAQLERYFYPDGHVAAFAGVSPRLARLEVEILDPPRAQVEGFGQFRALPPRQSVAARVKQVLTWDGWRRCDGEILIQLAEPHPRMQQGQRARVFGQLQRPSESMNPGQFNWAGHYRQRRVIATLHAAQADNVQIIGEARATLSPLQQARDYVRRVLADGFSSDRSLDHALLRALLLGDRDSQLRDVQEQFKRTGTGHHLAISGLHVAILGGMVALLCRLACLSPRVSLIVAMAFIIVYGLVALPSPPVVRSVLLCGAYAVGRTRRRSVDALQLLAVCALAMLIIAPLDLYNAGFQLSYFTVAGLAMFAGDARRWIEGLRSVDDRVLESLMSPTRSQTLRRWCWRRGSDVLAAGAVAWLVSAPLIAFHFQQLNPWAIPGSILLAPIVFFALMGGMLKIVLTILWPGASFAWAEVATWPIVVMRHTVDALAALPGADVPLAAQWRWLFVALYAFLLLRLLPPQGRWARQIPLAACIMLPMLPMMLGLSSRAPPPQIVRITALAVGAGSCNVIEMPDSSVTLVDCGSNTLFDLLQKCLAPYLRHYGHGDVKRMFLSHANYDHFSAADELMNLFDVEQVFISPLFVAHTAGNPPAQQLLHRLRELERPQTLLVESQSIEIPGAAGARMQVLWPPATSQADLSSNDSSMVLRFSYAGQSVLFTGDIQSSAQRELLRNPSRLKSDVLISPHHGSLEASTLDFIRAVGPRWIISSNDRVLSVKQKQFDDLMRREGIPHYRTHASGAVTIEINREGELAVTPYLPKHSE